VNGIIVSTLSLSESRNAKNLMENQYVEPSHLFDVKDLDDLSKSLSLLLPLCLKNRRNELPRYSTKD